MNNSKIFLKRQYKNKKKPFAILKALQKIYHQEMLIISKLATHVRGTKNMLLFP